MVATGPEPPVQPDGGLDRRRLRTERGRSAVVDALLALYEEGDPDPGAAAIAERAGVSERSVFRYFEDLEALAGAAIERQFARIAPAFAPLDSSGRVAERAATLANHRVRLHDRTGGVARAAALLAPSSPTIASALGMRRSMLRRQVADCFAGELAGHAARARTELLAALDAATSLEQVEYLRVHAGLSRPRTRNVMSRTITALLAERREEESDQ